MKGPCASLKLGCFIGQCDCFDYGFERLVDIHSSLDSLMRFMSSGPVLTTLQRTADTTVKNAQKIAKQAWAAASQFGLNLTLYHLRKQLKEAETMY